MSISSDFNEKLLQDNLEEILKKTKEAQLKVFEDMVLPEEIIKVYSIIKEYIKKNKRKIYGGYGLNELLKDKNPESAIYKENLENPKDIDFYSTDPIYDFINICNELHKAGLKFIMGQESLHRETYSIKVKNIEYCNISYVPKNIYNKMPFKEIDGYYYVHPYFMMIDMLRMFTDPLTSFWRLPKGIYSRFLLLEKYYPLPQNLNKKIFFPKHKELGEKALEIISKFIKDRKSTVLIGFMIYNIYLEESRSNNKKINIPYYEIISTDYKTDVLELLELLKENISPEYVRYEECYPFFQFIGYSVNIYVDDELVAKLYHNNNKCIPYVEVNRNRIGTFHLICQFMLIDIVKARVNDEDKDVYFTALSHIIAFRNKYLKDNKKTIFDKTIFEEFVIDCIGISLSNQMEKKLLIKHRKETGKRYIIRYDPSDKVIEPYNYIFANSSGNIINKKSNLKIANETENGTKDDEDIDIA